MSTLGSGRQGLQSRLTKLYSDTKLSLQAALPAKATNDLPEKLLLDRQFQYQKDRLIAWGLEWRDDYDNGDIDKSVERAGLTDVVESVLETAKGVLDELEKINNPAPIHASAYPIEKPNAQARRTQFSTNDLARYERLVQDLTDSITLLCDISKPPEAESSSSNGQKGKTDSRQAVHRPQGSRRPIPLPAYSQSGTSSVTLSSVTGDSAEQRDWTSSNLTKIDSSLIVLRQEGPPTYGESKTVMRGAASAPIVFGHIRQSGGSLLPVMVEFSRFDRLYWNTGMVLPLTRLDRLHAILGSQNTDLSATVSRPIAYFEDPSQPRYGLIYEFPPVVRDLQHKNPSQMYPEDPITLSNLLHQTSKLSRDMSSANPPSSIPALEERFRLAQRLVQGFSYLQQHDFSHRNVSSSSIALFLKGNGSPQPFDLRKPLVCAADLFSEFDLDPVPEALQQNIYRHPDDPRIRGPTAAESYEHRFDLYGLSLLLLEIGMWTPLSEMYKEKYSLKDFKLRVEKIWVTKELPQKSGTLYARCVKDLCQAGDQPQSANSAASQRRTLEKVQARLDKCCMIDEEEEDDIELDSPSEDDASTLITGEGTMSPAPFSPKAKQPTLESSSQWLTEEKGNEEKARPPRNIYTDLHVPDHIQAEYESFENRLLRIVTLALKHTQESSWIDLHYTGETKATARPTICVGCTSTKRVRTAIKKNLHYNDRLFDLAVIKDAIRRSKSLGGPRRSQATSDNTAKNPGHHERPLCGASIGAWRQSEHSPAVTFGGVILVDGEPYGMTVHHLLEDSEAEEKLSPMPTSSSADDQTIEDETDDEDNDDEDNDHDDIAEALDDNLCADPEPEEKDGYTRGVRRGQGEDIVLTQPALDDVDENFFPSEEDKDEDHIDSHRLGHVFASSGLRRAGYGDGVDHEIDWLLMKLDEERLQPYNVIAGGKIFYHEEALFSYRPKLLEPVCRQKYAPKEDHYPRNFLSSEQLSGLDVHCTGRTSGLGHGKISQRMRWVRFQGRSTFSQVWSATGSFGAGGDSGAWIISNDHGRICGHVLAYSDRFQIAYLSPMDILLQDISATLKAKVTLPGAADQKRPANSGRVELSQQALEQLGKSQQNLLARHMLHSGNPAPLEREWTAWRTRLGQIATT